MAREILTSPKLYAPKFRYSPCVKTGPWYTVSGMIALDAASGQLVSGGVYVETRKILELVQSALPDWGLTLADMTSARIFTTRFDQFAEINRAWEEVFAAQTPPARTSVGVAALPLGAAVEIEFAFYKD